MKNLKKLVKLHFGNNYLFGIFIFLFAVMLITRSFSPETRSPFGYDQVDNAWAAKNIIVEHNFPMTGMQAKGNTGFFIGPYYYYFLVPFYLLTGLNPIASNLAAITAAVISFFVVYFVTKAIFNNKTALIALFITTFSSYILVLDRTQWPVNFIVPVSMLMILSIYKICIRKPKYFYLLSALFGLSMHIHFTSVFYIPFILLIIPFFPRNKQTVKHALYSIPILLIFFWPLILNMMNSGNGGNALDYLGSSFHGFHLRRFFQIIGDGFIEFNAILAFPYSLIISMASFCFFIYVLFKSKLKKRYVIIAICLVWILVPWVLLSTYSGELTNYYFTIGRPIALFTFSYLLYLLYSSKNTLAYIVLVIVALFYSYTNLNHFFNELPVGLKFHWEKTIEKIEKGEKVEFVKGDPQSYLYYYYQLKNKK